MNDTTTKEGLSERPSMLPIYIAQLQDWQGTEDELDDLEAHIIRICSTQDEAWDLVEKATSELHHPAEIFLTTAAFDTASIMHELYEEYAVINLLSIRARINRNALMAHKAKNNNDIYRHYPFMCALGEEEDGKIVFYARRGSRNRSDHLVRDWDLMLCGLRQKIVPQDKRKKLCPECAATL